MFLILTNREDETALKVADVLTEKNPNLVRLLVVEDLAVKSQWIHCLDENGIATTKLIFDGEQQILSEDIDVVFNRLRYVNLPHFNSAKPKDRLYALEEMHALLLSWLASFSCPIVNIPDPFGLGGNERSLVEWMSMAGRIGLPTHDLSISTAFNSKNTNLVKYNILSQGGRPLSRTIEKAMDSKDNEYIGLFLEDLDEARNHSIFIVDGVAYNGLSTDIDRKCCELVRLGKLNLAECIFSKLNSKGTLEGSDWVFNGINLFPEITDRSLIKIIVNMLEEKTLNYRQSQKEYYVAT